MALSSWLRLRLPLGNVLLLIAIVEAVDLLRNDVKYMILIYHGLTLNSSEISENYDTSDLISIPISTTLRLILTFGLLWIGVIMKGSLGCLLAYIIMTVLQTIGSIVFDIVVAMEYEIGTNYAWAMAHNFLFIVFVNAYFILIAGVSYRALSRQETLDPIGKGLAFIWEYFSNETKIAARFFLTSEIVLDADNLISRQFMRFFGIHLMGHYGDSYAPIIIEEIVLRVIRIVVNAIGIWLVSSERRRVLRWWCAFTFLLILVSTTIFIILTVQWRGEDISSTLVYFIMFPGHLLYRFVTLYFCLKYSRADFSSFVL